MEQATRGRFIHTRIAHDDVLISINCDSRQDLVAMLNIYRVYYNWLKARQYVGPGSAGKATADVEMGLSSVRVPGSVDVV